MGYYLCMYIYVYMYIYTHIYALWSCKFPLQTLAMTYLGQMFSYK